MSEQIFPVWTKISVNKSFMVYLHKIAYDEILLSKSVVYSVSALPGPYASLYACVRLPLSQSDHRIRSVFQSVYNKSTCTHVASFLKSLVIFLSKSVDRRMKYVIHFGQRFLDCQAIMTQSRKLQCHYLTLIPWKSMLYYILNIKWRHSHCQNFCFEQQAADE